MQVNMDNSTKINKLEGLERAITITVPKQGYKSTFDKYLVEYRSKAKFDGFRSGKAPDKLILSKYKNQIHKESVNDLVETHLQKVLSENNLQTASPPQLSIDSEPSFENDFIFTVKFEVIPAFEIEDLSNMSIEDFEVEIDENDIDEVIKNIQKQHTKWEKTKEKAVAGNKIIIDYEALVDNKEFDGSKQKDFTFVLDDSIKGDVATVELYQKFFKAVANETSASKIKFTYDIPNDFPDKNISGKKAEYNVFIKAIYKGIMPKLNKEFYKKFGLDDCDDKKFRENILDHMRHELEGKISSHRNASINQALVDTNTFEIPKYLIESEKQSIMTQYKGMMKNIDDVTKTELNKVAIKRAKLNLIFMKIAETLKINITEQDIYNFISKRYPSELTTIIEKMKKDQKYLNQLKNQVLENDIMEHIKKQCKLNKVKKSFSEVMN